MSEFLLTHLHADHYSGITKQLEGTKLSFDVDHVFLPALPLIKDCSLTQEFALALFTLNAILGRNSGIPEQDLIDKFTELNPSGSKPCHTFLSKGDSFDLAGTTFQVLWPPRAIYGLAAESAQTAVEEFNKAIEDDNKAKDIRDQLVKRAKQVALHAERYAKNECESDDHPTDDNGGPLDESTDRKKSSDIEGEVPEAIKKANKAIRGVANRLSLAFRCGHRLIHFGDLECAELNQVVTDLGTAKQYYGMIAAHHGTHFGSSMKNLRALHLIISNGKLRPKFKKGYFKIASHIQETNVHGHSFLVF